MWLDSRRKLPKDDLTETATTVRRIVEGNLSGIDEFMNKVIEGVEERKTLNKPEQSCDFHWAQGQ